MSIFENPKFTLILGCAAIFFPGALIFGFPGVMALEWQQMFHASRTDVGRVMFFILAGSGSSMYLAGVLQEKYGSRPVIFTGSLVCSLGPFFVAHAENMTHVYAWAFVEGFFVGFVYIPCLSLFQQLFPAKKGLITGIVNLTFGGAAAVMSPLFTYILVTFGYQQSAVFSAVVSLCCGTVAACFVRRPAVCHDCLARPLPTLSFGRTIRMSSFWYLWWVWALAGASGISMIVLAAVFGSHLGYGPTEYVYLLTGFSILNGTGRLVCGRLADSYSKRKIMALVFILAAAAYFMLPFTRDLAGLTLLAAVIGLAFGVLFTVSAPLVTDVFGLENFGRIFGLVFTAYGFFAGGLGPWLSGVILDAGKDNFGLVFRLFACYYLIAALMILKVRPLLEPDRQNQETI